MVGGLVLGDRWWLGEMHETVLASIKDRPILFNTKMMDGQAGNATYLRCSDRCARTRACAGSGKYAGNAERKTGGVWVRSYVR